MQINLTPDWSLLAIMAIFIANYFVVRHFFLRPVNRLLIDRKQEIQSSEALFEESMTRFGEATSEMEARLAEARKKGAEVREARRAEAAAQRSQLLGATRTSAEQMTSQAETELRAETASARERIVRESEALARLAAEKILGRNLA
ncbi:MAG TPA: ATP synthase F0 subunit B [Thermoanaerobaculia bacterium]